MITLYAKQKETQMYRTDFWTLWEKARVGCSEGIALKQVYYQGWNRSPAQVACMRQVFRAAALGRPRGMAWGTHVNPWLIHVNVWQKPLQYCKVISLQLIKINEKKKKHQIYTPFWMAWKGLCHMVCFSVNHVAPYNTMLSQAWITHNWCS